MHTKGLVDEKQFSVEDIPTSSLPSFLKPKNDVGL
jgi:hypothetical protein